MPSLFDVAITHGWPIMWQTHSPLRHANSLWCSYNTRLTDYVTDTLSTTPCHLSVMWLKHTNDRLWDRHTLHYVMLLSVMWLKHTTGRLWVRHTLHYAMSPLCDVAKTRLTDYESDTLSTTPYLLSVMWLKHTTDRFCHRHTLHYVMPPLCNVAKTHDWPIMRQTHSPLRHTSSL